MHRSIHELLKLYRDLIRDPSVDVRVKMWAKGELAELRPHLAEVRRDGAYQDFLLSYIQREAVKMKARLNGDPYDHPFDGTRDQPVCTCDGACPLKREELPKEFRDAPTIDEGARRFRHAHPGHPIVVDDGRQAYAQLVGDVEDSLVRIVVGLANNCTPGDEEWPDDSPADKQIETPNPEPAD